MFSSKWHNFFQFIQRPLFILVTYFIIFYLFHKYDWGFADIKAICFLALFLLILHLTANRGKATYPKLYLDFEILFYIVFILYFLFSFGPQYFGKIETPAISDVGYITHNALKALVLEHQDPYNTTLKTVGSDPRFWGYTYGPGMLIFYFPSVFYTSAALKVISAIYLLFLFLVIYLIIKQECVLEEAAISGFLLSVLLFVIPERFWYETLTQGATDILPIMLITLSTYFIYKKQFLLVGLFAGLSFSSKFVPAIFFIILFLRKKINRPFFLGLGLGLIPFIFFLAWSGFGLINNVFLFNFVKTYDSTSLYSVIPVQYQILFLAIQIAAVLLFVAYNFNNKLEPRSILIHFTLLLIIIEMTYSEVHANHLIWFIPLLALIFSINRHD
jgi:hypothetical protein